MKAKQDISKKNTRSLTQPCNENINENLCYDDDDALLVIREEDPEIEEKLDCLFGKLSAENTDV